MVRASQHTPSALTMSPRYRPALARVDSHGSGRASRALLPVAPAEVAVFRATRHEVSDQFDAGGALNQPPIVAIDRIQVRGRSKGRMNLSDFRVEAPVRCQQHRSCDVPLRQNGTFRPGPDWMWSNRLGWHEADYRSRRPGSPNRVAQSYFSSLGWRCPVALPRKTLFMQPACPSVASRRRQSPSCCFLFAAAALMFEDFKSCLDRGAQAEIEETLELCARRSFFPKSFLQPLTSSGYGNDAVTLRLGVRTVGREEIECYTSSKEILTPLPVGSRRGLRKLGASRKGSWHPAVCVLFEKAAAQVSPARKAAACASTRAMRCLAFDVAR